MKIFGTHDPQTIAQFTDVASRARDAALMADGHVGYVMPIGGVTAYENQVSVVGVGFDIACLAAGTPVVTADGYHVPIEQVDAYAPVVCWDGERTRRVEPLLGGVARGVRRTLRVGLANGRHIIATPDHRVLTPGGWREAGALVPGDRVGCQPFVGMPHEAYDATIPTPVRGDAARAALAARGLIPLRGGDARLPALVRLLAYVSGDGHLSRDGEAVSVYTVHEEDAAAVAADFGRVGFSASTYRRVRGAGSRVEICVRVASTALHALLAALGSPVGRKSWGASPMEWLFDAPPWVRAQYLSAFASAEMMTPRCHANGVVPNLQLKQAGSDDNAIRLVARLCESLGFAVSVAPSGAPYAGRRVYVLQLLGGTAAQVDFAERVGFCYAAGKRIAAARTASLTWERAVYVRARAAARDEARALHASGTNRRAIMHKVATRHGVSAGFVRHAIYSGRGAPRRAAGAATEADTDGELCWVPVDSTADAGVREVYDVVTADAAESFLAAGVVVHNCGNAAIRTDLTLADLGGDPERLHASLNAVADEIADRVSFGVGRKNRAGDAPVDHPLFQDEAWYAVPAKERKRLRTKARQQLGTVGSGNHYVDVFADEAGTLWVGVHFGSRGFGHTVASAFLALGQGKKWGERAPEREVLLDLDAPVGHDYWHLMNLAGRYAYAGREWVARKVVSILGGREVELVHNHHNFAWRERLEGEDLIVVRKGATPAFPGQKGFIGGSMADDAVIVQGAIVPDTDQLAVVQREALHSTIHGAGRVMSRTQAAGKRNRRTGEVLAPGRVTPEMMAEWLAAKGVVLRGGGLDESPHVYRRLPEVLGAQEGTVDVVHTLRPLVVVMAGADEFDPYKD
jgi:tRNA-splicing ligase RtcB